MRTLLLRLFGHLPDPLARRLAPGSRLARVLRPLVNAVVPGGEHVVTVQSGPLRGARLRIDPQREKYYWTGAYEPQVQAFLAGRLHPGDVFWDVGAHLGFFTCLGARLVGERGSVVAWEPVPDNVRRLGATVALNGLDNVEICAEAVGETEGTAVLVPSGSTTMWSVQDEDGEGGSTVRRATLDSRAGTRHPAVIKIDVEGLEAAVLRGAGRIIAAAMPALVVELHDEDALAEIQALLPAYRAERVDERHWSFVATA